MWQDRDSVYYDNMWCIDPEETISFMKTVRKPWIAYKVLAAGAIYPREGFSYAFKNGADFIAVGMFDFQVKEDSELTCKVLRQTQTRLRAWRA
jgi:NAD(P)H-dependent flavin oxidoreductase YrpB (nitropropane dioxygenase family)